MLAALDASPTIMFALLERVTRLLHNARAMRELRNIRSAEERVLQHLQFSVAMDGKLAFDQPLLEVAEDLGLTHEAYYRALAGLSRKGVIKRKGRTIRLTGAVQPG
jgi:CRP-like cAMP-binding protein